MKTFFKKLFGDKELDVKTKLNIDRYGRNNLINNVINNNINEVIQLIENGTDINFQDKNGWTSLHFASQNFNEKMITYLLNNGAYPNIKDANGNTPFSTALFNCKGVETDIFEQFKIKGGNPEIQNNYGVSPLDLAKKISNFDLKKYFPEYFNKVIIPKTKNVPLLRTDFSNEKEWKNIIKLINQRYNGFKANIEIVEDKKFENFEIKDFLALVPIDYNNRFIFLVDNQSLNNNDLTIVCLDLTSKPAKYFRVIPGELWSVENNLSIANMDFEEFYDNTDSKGVFRGFN